MTKLLMSSVVGFDICTKRSINTNAEFYNLAILVGQVGRETFRSVKRYKGHNLALVLELKSKGYIVGEE
jgi:hypothetical protein